MLIEFSVGNFLSFKDTVTLSMLAAPISEHEDSNVFVIDKLRLLKSSAIYGANASGKSNFIKAMAFMKWFTVNSSKETQAEEPIRVENFKLSTETENKPSFFEVVFILGQKKYRYGFEVDKYKVHSEWLFFTPSRREAMLFTRDENGINIGTYFKEGKGLEDKTRSNALFLSVVAQFNGEKSAQVLDWFGRFMLIAGLNDDLYMRFTLSQLRNKDFRSKFLEYLRMTDLGINDVSIESIRKGKTRISELPKPIRNSLIVKDNDNREDIDVELLNVSTLHNKYNEDGKAISKEKIRLIRESDGTQKFFGLLGPILDTLDKAFMLAIDELDARFHPMITRFIIELFHSKQTNPNNAQLIFATHDTNLLTNELFRRDQIWFTEKNQYEATDLYSLVEYRGIRKDASFEKDYIEGKYGAIPFIGNAEILMGSENE